MYIHILHVTNSFFCRNPNKITQIQNKDIVKSNQHAYPQLRKPPLSNTQKQEKRKQAEYMLYVSVPIKHVAGMVRISNCTQTSYVLNMENKNAE